MEVHKDLKTLLDDAINLRNISPDKLSEITSVPERYIWAIQNMEVNRLPPPPYVRGYLKKISEALHLNHDEIWDLYKRELEQNTSGKHDRLPVNRFAIQKISKGVLVAAGIGILILIYLLAALPKLLGAPNLIVTNPTETITSVSENPIILTGSLERNDRLLINGEELAINENHTFSKSYTLQPGLNTIEFKASRLLGREKVVLRQIVYEPKP